MKTPTADRRVARTRQALHEALIGLILEKGYDAVTVQDIVVRANVGRSTFYAHHGGKEGLLKNGLQSLREEMLAVQRLHAGDAAGAQRLLGFSAAFFAHTHGHRELYQALVRHGGSAVVDASLRRLLFDLVRRELAPLRPAGRAGALPADALARFVADAMFSLLLWWHDRAPRLSPDEVETIFRRLVMPTLRNELN